jgi:hypothetical protein
MTLPQQFYTKIKMEAMDGKNSTEMEREMIDDR